LKYCDNVFNQIFFKYLPYFLLPFSDIKFCSFSFLMLSVSDFSFLINSLSSIAGYSSSITLISRSIIWFASSPLSWSIVLV
jgi:hypothetical protein